MAIKARRECPTPHSSPTFKLKFVKTAAIKMQNTSQSFWRSWNNDLESYTLGIQLHVSECYLVKITNLGDGKWSNKWNVITNHSFDTVETVSNEGKSTSCVQKEDTWESNTTNNSTEWNSSNNTFLKSIVTTVRAVQWLLRSGKFELQKLLKTNLVDMCVESWFSFDLMFHPEHIVFWDISLVGVTCQRLSQNASWSSQKSLGCSTGKHFRF